MRRQGLQDRRLTRLVRDARRPRRSRRGSFPVRVAAGHPARDREGRPSGATGLARMPSIPDRDFEVSPCRHDRSLRSTSVAPRSGRGRPAGRLSDCPNATETPSELGPGAWSTRVHAALALRARRRALGGPRVDRGHRHLEPRPGRPARRRGGRAAEPRPGLPRRPAGRRASGRPSACRRSSTATRTWPRSARRPSAPAAASRRLHLRDRVDRRRRLDRDRRPAVPRPRRDGRRARPRPGRARRPALRLRRARATSRPSRRARPSRAARARRSRRAPARSSPTRRRGRPRRAELPATSPRARMPATDLQAS